MVGAKPNHRASNGRLFGNDKRCARVDRVEKRGSDWLAYTHGEIVVDLEGECGMSGDLDGGVWLRAALEKQRRASSR